MSTERPEIDAFDEWIYDGSIESIPDEMVTLDRTKHGIITLNRRGIFNMAVRGYNATDIAEVFGCTRQTIANNFEREITAGKGMIGPRLKANLLRQAMRDDKVNHNLLIFALKNYTDMTEDGPRAGSSTDDGKTSWEVEVLKVEKPIGLTASEKAELEEDEDSND